MSEVPLKKMSFESALQELEEIVRRLEEGKVPLEEAIRSYERGTALRQYCEEKLSQAKMRIEKISLAPADSSIETSEGNIDVSITLTPFDPTRHDN